MNKAENDLKTAVHTLQLGEECPTDTICFHAQQCIEKYTKAFLVSAGIEFPKTHDIEELIVLMPVHARPALSAEEQRRLTAYATATRYPGNNEEVSLTEARIAVKIAIQIRKKIRSLLPKGILLSTK